MFDLRSIPADSTRKEHIGQLDKIVWADADRPVSILRLTDGKSVIVDAPPSDFHTGQRFRFLGRWQEGRMGPEFRATSYVHDTPHTESGVTRYLCKTCDGIGERLAARLWAAYGPDTIATLREQPEKIAADKLLSLDAAREAARDLARFAGLERTRVDLFGLFAGRGFPGKLVEHALAKWGAKAPEVIRADPFRMLTARLPGCGWKRCDKLYLDGGGRREAVKRQALAGWHALREDRTGSTWVPAATVVQAIADAVPGSADPVKAIKLGVRGGLFRVRRDGEARWVAVADHARAEQRVVDSLARLLASAPQWPAELPVSASEGDGLPSAQQAEQLRSATAAAVGCFTGGPGTGKTHSLSFVLREIVARWGESAVAVAAPTGKAAVRATESLAARGLSIRATTIHQLLEIGRSGHDGGGWGFCRNRDNPLSQRFVVVDEASMLDTTLAADLLDACGDGTHVLLVGDPFQLPPVGHGAPLRDMLAAGVAQGNLTEVRRNAGLIVRGCESIKAGRVPEFAAHLDLGDADPRNLAFIEARPADVLGIVESLLRGFSRFDPVWDCQILTAVNDKSDLSRKSINERLAKVLNPDGRRVNGIPFAVGDKVICLKNTRLRPAAPTGKLGSPEMYENAGYYEIGKEAESFVANGEVGRVTALSTGGMVVTVGARGVWVAKSKPRTDDNESGEGGGGGMGDWDLAYGITTHKSQGGEWPVVIVLADKAGGGVADRNWWYTAISRASKACLIVGDRTAFDSQCRRQSITQRKTFLAELLTARP